MKSKNLSKHGQEIENALQEAVADAIEEHRRAMHAVHTGAVNGPCVHSRARTLLSRSRCQILRIPVKPAQTL